MSGIVTAIAGAPLNIGVTGQNVCSVVPNCANRPDVTGPLNNPHTVNESFDTAAFTMPAGTSVSTLWGDTPRNYVRGPGRQNWNVSFFKNFMFNEERRRQPAIPRGVLSNLWNHPQWQGDTLNGGVSTNLGASNFGAITNAYDPREIQTGFEVLVLATVPVAVNPCGVADHPPPRRIFLFLYL